MYTTHLEFITSYQHPNFSHIFELNEQIPELERGVSLEEIKQRIGEQSFLLLVAYVEGEVAGYKLGYALDEQTFYSWVGGVAEDFRKLGIAERLLKAQEQWVQQQQYSELTVKTQNRFTAMLAMLVKHRYHIVDIENHTANRADNKMLLAKRFN